MNNQVDSRETTKILELAKTCTTLAGDFVEFGCYRGDTSVELAKLLDGACATLSEKRGGEGACATLFEERKDLAPRPGASSKKDVAQASRHIWLYDSFEGLPAKSPADESAAGVNFQPGALHVSRRALIDKLKKHGLNNAIIKKAWFSNLTDQDLPDKIAFAFIDGDFYESQRTALALVEPRLIEQGIIVCHDYNNPELPGATQAVDEFMKQHPEYHLNIFQTLAIIK